MPLQLSMLPVSTLYQYYNYIIYSIILYNSIKMLANCVKQFIKFDVQSLILRLT